MSKSRRILFVFLGLFFLGAGAAQVGRGNPRGGLGCWQGDGLWLVMWRLGND